MVEYLGQQLKMLGLNEKERKILLALLVREHMTVSDIARIAKLPRTTVTPILEKLRRRGLLERIAVKRHKEWRVLPPKMLYERLSEALSVFEERGEGDVVGVPSRDVGIFVCRGKSQIEKAYERMLDLSKTERALVVQGNKSAEATLQKLDKRYLFLFHEKIKKQQIILEGIAGEHLLKLFKDLDIDLLKSHKDRLVIAHILPDEYMNFDEDFVVFRDVMLMINAREEVVVFIKNKSIVEGFRSIFAALQTAGKKIDLNAYIQNVIDEKEKK